jgi:hypothetical protein
MYAFVKKNGTISKRRFSQQFSRGTVARDRDADLAEMIQRGWIQLSGNAAQGFSIRAIRE